jgi:hypothetical protein
MAATPTVMTYFAIVQHRAGRTRRVAVSLPYVAAIADQAHYRPPPDDSRFEYAQEHRRNVTESAIRRALGRDPKRLRAALDLLGFERAMRRVDEDGW